MNLNAQVKNERKGRKRRLTGWTLIALGLLVAGVWGASRWWEVRKAFNGWSAGVYEGQVGVSVGEISADDLVVERTYLERWVFWQGWDHSDLGVGKVWTRGFTSHTETTAFPRLASTNVLLWPIPLLLWAAGVPVLRSGIVARRRANTGACGKCGYSLAGLGAGAGCPECGTVRSGAERMNAGSEAVRTNGPPQSSDGGTK